jgi:hypothetical protein
MSSKQEELDILIQKREELLKFISNHDLTQENHILKFYELQDINLEILKLNLNYDFNK